jgi:hypothetical protein
MSTHKGMMTMNIADDNARMSVHYATSDRGSMADMGPSLFEREMTCACGGYGVAEDHNGIEIFSHCQTCGEMITEWVEGLV